MVFPTKLISFCGQELLKPIVTKVMKRDLLLGNPLQNQKMETTINNFLKKIVFSENILVTSYH
jgi:hypothetical protein